MTEAEWLTCADPAPMLAHLRVSGRASESRLRLCACACVRMGAWRWLVDERCRKAVESREGFEHGLLCAEELKPIQLEAWRALVDAVDAKSPAVDAVRAAAEAAGQPYPSWSMRVRVAEDREPWWRDPDRMWADETGRWLERVLELAARAATQSEDGTRAEVPQTAWSQERACQCAVLRCLLGNPFSPPAPLDPAWLRWDGGTVKRLAGAADEARSLSAGTLDNARLGVLADALEDAGCADADMLGHLRGPGPHVRGCWALDLLLGRS